jgi:hypothetical protein
MGSLPWVSASDTVLILQRTDDMWGLLFKRLGLCDSSQKGHQFLKIYLIFVYVYVWTCADVCAVHVCDCGRKMTFYTQRIELWVAVSFLMWVLGTKPESFAGAVRALHYWSISPASVMNFHLKRDFSCSNEPLPLIRLSVKFRMWMLAAQRFHQPCYYNWLVAGARAKSRLTDLHATFS